MTTDTDQKNHAFQADVAQLLQLVVHALYSDQQIFLRELLSNAGDACERLRFESVSHPTWKTDDRKLRIRVSRQGDSILVSDNGIGMDRQEVLDNIGTIARSGTRRFLAQLKDSQSSDVQQIGQFGVGFYASFMVAEEVTLRTRRVDREADEGVCWRSQGKEHFSLTPWRGEQHGTEVELLLRSDLRQTLDAAELRRIIKRFAYYLSFPIEMPVEKTASEDSADAGSAEDSSASESGAEGEWECVNQPQALWRQPKAAIERSAYEDFYRQISHDSEAPLAWAHNHVEGSQSYSSLLYIPATAGAQDPWQEDGDSQREAIALYVQRVFICPAGERLLPRYLSFVRGVVDCQDLSLNVSRELLQQHQQLTRIKQANTRRILTLLQKMAKDDKDDYRRFWKQFGSFLKQGVAEDQGNRDILLPLLRMSSTRGHKENLQTSLDEYVEQMPLAQEAIYYVTAESLQVALQSPHLEGFLARDIEVLLLHDRVDEWMMGWLPEYRGKPLCSVAKGEAPKALQQAAEETTQPDDKAPWVAFLRQALEEVVSDVRISSRLSRSAVCLVADEHGLALHLQRSLRQAGQNMPTHKLPVLEVNPAHPLLRYLASIADEDEETRGSWARLLYDQAILAEGGQLEDPGAFSRRLEQLWFSSLCADVSKNA